MQWLLTISPRQPLFFFFFNFQVMPLLSYNLSHHTMTFYNVPWHPNFLWSIPGQCDFLHFLLQASSINIIFIPLQTVTHADTYRSTRTPLSSTFCIRNLVCQTLHFTDVIPGFYHWIWLHFISIKILLAELPTKYRSLLLHISTYKHYLKSSILQNTT